MTLFKTEKCRVKASGMSGKSLAQTAAGKRQVMDVASWKKRSHVRFILESLRLNVDTLEQLHVETTLVLVVVSRAGFKAC